MIRCHSFHKYLEGTHCASNVLITSLFIDAASFQHTHNTQHSPLRLEKVITFFIEMEISCFFSTLIKKSIYWLSSGITENDNEFYKLSVFDLRLGI